MPKTEEKTLLVIGAAIVVLAFLAGGLWYWQANQKYLPKACTMEAKLCSDGSYVGRTGLNCEFAPCPEIKNETADWKTYRNEKYGFEVKYPDDFNVSEGADFLAPQPIEGIVMEHSIQLRNGKEFIDVWVQIELRAENIDYFLNSLPFSELTSVMVKVDEKKGFKFDTSYEGVAGSTIILGRDKKSTFVIDFSYSGGYQEKDYYVPSMADQRGDEFVNQLFNQILSAFKFIK